MTPREKAQLGLVAIEEAIIDYLRQRPDGAINNDIARELSLESDFEGRQANHLTWSVLGGLVKAQRVVHEKLGQKRVYKIAKS